ncbi:hypothetical protein GCK72_012789 [Caenorhabditis remanei]|uniref:Uncharacterized protein n=1 Tax=Caenorhabditis remanei TaxID=31234 RepID=A0A6A5GPA0_CAERE|nr:hypothetical protein GCK72_012789 [Caenorhabditis remanei]KAF1756336.1 hypothetical protein GCK72_012789 [Caenorhabditis remanei]
MSLQAAVDFFVKHKEDVAMGLMVFCVTAWIVFIMYLALKYKRKSIALEIRIEQLRERIDHQRNIINDYRQHRHRIAGQEHMGVVDLPPAEGMEMQELPQQERAEELPQQERAEELPVGQEQDDDNVYERLVLN